MIGSPERQSDSVADYVGRPGLRHEVIADFKSQSDAVFEPPMQSAA
jgi:hypothetical protein